MLNLAAVTVSVYVSRLVLTSNSGQKNAHRWRIANTRPISVNACNTARLTM
jgi:hypothetical protein